MGRTRPQRRPHTCTYKHTESKHSCSAGWCVAIQAEHLQELSGTTTRRSGVSLVTKPPAACKSFQIRSAALCAFRRPCSSRKAPQVSGYSSWISHCWLGLSSFSGITTTCSLSYALPPAENRQQSWRRGGTNAPRWKDKPAGGLPPGSVKTFHHIRWITSVHFQPDLQNLFRLQYRFPVFTKGLGSSDIQTRKRLMKDAKILRIYNNHNIILETNQFIHWI